MEDKIILKFKTKNILNFYEIEPWSHLSKIIRRPKLSFFQKTKKSWFLAIYVRL